ncbi:MAG TPA: PfkB family carbohydrate kinase [Kofleriaceae bacterium]|nr:PfkB family carbohydrate kinase [Kofleriaceae bacterium]
MRRVVAIGLAGYDILGVVPAYPERDTKVRLVDVAFAGGGPAATAAAAAARLGAPTAFVGRVGDDDLGRAILRGLEEVGVDVSGTVVAPGRSPLSFVAIDRGDASRTVFHAPTDVAPLRPEQIDWRCLEGAGVLLIDGREVAVQREAAERARRAGATVLLDAERIDDDVRSLMAVTDVCVASEKLGRALAADDDAALAALAALGPRDVVITLGARGSIGRAAGGPIVRQPIFAVDAVDTTGCGDVYHGAYAVALLRGLDLAACMRMSAGAAALKCRALGGRSALPTSAELDALLRL